MRSAFIKELVQHARKKDNIALVVGDLGFSVIEPFADEFPERFFQEVMDYLGMNPERFFELCDAARSPHLWELENGTWKLRHQVS